MYWNRPPRARFLGSPSERGAQGEGREASKDVFGTIGRWAMLFISREFSRVDGTTHMYSGEYSQDLGFGEVDFIG